MYFVEWKDCDGIERSFVAEGYIERLVIEDELELYKYEYTVTVL